jgi:hypothetical protein
MCADDDVVDVDLDAPLIGVVPDVHFENALQMSGRLLDAHWDDAELENAVGEPGRREAAGSLVERDLVEGRPDVEHRLEAECRRPSL